MYKTQTGYIRRLLTHVILLGFAILFVAPFIWMVSTSLKPDDQLFVNPPQWIPHPFRFLNYWDAIHYIPFFTYLKNTIIITGVSTLGVIVSCPLVAYSLAKLKWVGRGAVFALTVGVLMIPGQVTMIPLFILFHNLGWVGTPLPLIVHPILGVPIYIFLLRQFFLGLPSELQQAARIDGAAEFRIYWQIMLPAALPAVLAVGLFQFMNSWHDFIGPLLYLNDPSLYTLSLGLQQFQSEMGTEWGMMMAVATLMTLPIIVLFFFLQKTFIQGITFTGIKG